MGEFQMAWRARRSTLQRLLVCAYAIGFEAAGQAEIHERLQSAWGRVKLSSISCAEFSGSSFSYG
jgi:hypothetical protein